MSGKCLCCVERGKGGNGAQHLEIGRKEWDVERDRERGNKIQTSWLHWMKAKNVTWRAFIHRVYAHFYIHFCFRPQLGEKRELSKQPKERKKNHSDLETKNGLPMFRPHAYSRADSLVVSVLSLIIVKIGERNPPKTLNKLPRKIKHTIVKRKWKSIWNVIWCSDANVIFQPKTDMRRKLWNVDTFSKFLILCAH